ncbi:MAG: integrase, partial [Mesorhizobium sp.]
RWLKEAKMADSTRSMRKAIFDRDILPLWEKRLLAEITPDDLRALCAKVRDRGAPATAVHIRDVVKQIY